MKFANSILMFPLFLYDSGAMDEANACMNREYETYDNYIIERKFAGEYSIFFGGEFV